MPKVAEGFLVSLGVLAVMLIAFYGLSHLIIRFAPSPVSGIVSSVVQRTTAAGWSNS
jgi:hypothetical protein